MVSGHWSLEVLGLRDFIGGWLWGFSVAAACELLGIGALAA